MSNNYLEGNYAPVREEHTITELAVTGTIPAHLDGRYLRIGPNPIAEVDPETYQWLTGDGMVHGVRLRDGKAEWYRNRWVRTPAVARALGEAARRRAPIRTGFEMTGANINVLSHAGRTLALMEGGVTNYELTDDLDTVGPCDFDGTLRGGYTGHPKRDPDTGELHAVSYSWGRGNRVQYSVIGVDGRAHRTVDVKVTGSPMMHDFSLTENHVVFYDLPVTFNPRQAAAMSVPPGMRAPTRLLLATLVGRVRWPEPIMAMATRGMRPNLPYRWNPSYPARVGVMPRAGGAGDVRWFDIEPSYVFHALNAYDEGNSIVLDVVRHPKMFDTELRGPNEGPPPWSAGPLTSPTARSARPASTIIHRNTLASMTGSSAGRIVTGTRYRRPGATLATRCSSTTCAAARPPRGGWAPTSASASSPSSPMRRRPPRTTGCSWDSSTTPAPTAAI
jgi:carotenoid cleavage oxygenase